MTAVVEYLANKASETQIAEHLASCDADFVPPLSARTEIEGYAKKIACKATRFEAWSGGTLVGLVAAYFNEQEKCIAYITNVSVLREWMGQGVAARLVGQCVKYAEALGMRQVSLEVAEDNTPAIKLYEKSGFVIDKTNGPLVGMILNLKSGEEHGQQT